MTESYVTLSYVNREMIADPGVPLWALLAFFAEGAGDEAEARATERGLTVDRASAVAVGATAKFGDSSFRTGDGVVRIVWPMKEPS